MPKIEDLPSLDSKYLSVALNGYAHLVLDPEMPHHRPDKIMAHPVSPYVVLLSLGDGMWRERPVSALRWLGNQSVEVMLKAGILLYSAEIHSVTSEIAKNGVKAVELFGAGVKMRLAVGSPSDTLALFAEHITDDAIKAGQIHMILLRK